MVYGKKFQGLQDKWAGYYIRKPLFNNFKKHFEGVVRKQEEGSLPMDCSASACFSKEKLSPGNEEKGEKLFSEEGLIACIDESWEKCQREDFIPDNRLQAAVTIALRGLDQGIYRAASPEATGWVTHPWVKKALLLSFRLQKNRIFSTRPSCPSGFGIWYDKITSKFEGWEEEHFNKAQLRVVPGAFVRFSAHIGPRVVLMPSYVNIGAYIGEGTMVDTWATIGSCAQIGRNCHISGGVGIGGVLEPLQANPVIIEDNCFIGARSEIAEGVIIGQGAVISMGVFLGQSTKIVERATGKVHYGYVPPYSVVVPGTLPPQSFLASQDGVARPHLSCAVIVKQVDEKTRSRTSLTDLLRYEV